MFQTGPNLFLQSFASDTLTSVMVGISAMGDETFFALALAIVIFGVSFARGFLLLQLLLWSALLNSALKDAFALPRPVHVDARVLNDSALNATPFTSMGATSFFAAPPPDVVAKVRAVVPPGFDDYGFPSGHAQSTTVLWGSAAHLWDTPAIRRLAPFVILMMAVSRMYLGRHFLADVLGGAVLGALVVVALALARRRGWETPLFDRSGTALRAALPNAAIWLLLILAPLAVITYYPGRGGAMLGIGAGFLAVMRRGAPDDGGTRGQRAERVGIALLLYAAASGVLALAVGVLGLDDRATWVTVVSKGVPSFLMIWGTVAAARRAGLYRGHPEAGR